MNHADKVRLVRARILSPVPDYSVALIDARKQLANAEAAAALHDYGLALGYVQAASGNLEAMTLSLTQLRNHDAT